MMDRIFFAGQMTGVEGYVESAASGLIAGINAALIAYGKRPVIAPRETVIGSLAHYVTHASTENFQPMNATFGLLPSLEEKVRDKRERASKVADRALAKLAEMGHGL